MSSRRATNLTFALCATGMIAGVAGIFGVIPVERAFLFAFIGSGMGALISLHVRAMGWDTDD